MIGRHLRTITHGGLVRSFARVKVGPAPSFKDKLADKAKADKRPQEKVLLEEDRTDPNDPDITEKLLSLMHMRPQSLPEK